MFTENLDTFFGEFGSDATLAGVPVRGVFDNASALGAVGFSGMAGTQPTYTLPTASITGEAVGQTMVINAATYTVAAHEPDGTGVSRLFLEVAS